MSRIAAVILCALVPTVPLAAQETPRSADADLRAFAATVVEIGRIRDEIAVQMARPENKTVERQSALQAEFQARTAAAIKGHGLTQERYDHLQVLVTTDEDWRVVFERRLTAAKAAPRAAPTR